MLILFRGKYKSGNLATLETKQQIFIIAFIFEGEHVFPKEKLF